VDGLNAFYPSQPTPFLTTTKPYHLSSRVLKVKMPTYAQFLVFINDSVGLERTLRLLQSLFLVTASYPLPLHYFSTLLASFTTTGSATPILAQTIAQGIIQKLNFVRRFFRLFKFLHCFNSAQTLYSSSSLDKTAWVDGLGNTFMGLYLLLDASLIVDALQIDGLRVWTPQWERTVTVEAQRFWLFALVCGVVSAGLKMVDVWALRPTVGVEVKAPEEKTEMKEKDGNGDGVGEKKAAKAAAVRKQIKVLQRDVAANALDIVLPAAVVGWIHVGPGVVGLAMFTTTILTMQGVWERCGKAVKAAN
jgi:hypothetical protein